MKLLHFLSLSSFCLLALPLHAQPPAPTSTPIASQIGPSLRAHLQLKAAQIEKLNELYDNWTTNRSDSAAMRERALKILTPLQRAQLDSIARDSRLRIRDDQYSQLLLPTVRTTDDTRYENSQRDDYRDNSRSENNRRDNERQREGKKSRQSNRRRNGSGSYGVYGGYGYGGPNYGVYGNYGQGNIGVSGTIGRYGPSIGVNVGRVFGGRWLR